MKINVAVVFGGRSVENEISILSALQVINAIDTQKYNIIPVFISKSGQWLSGDLLLKVDNYKDIDTLTAGCQSVYMQPIYDDYNLYKKRKPLFGSAVLAPIDVVLPVLHGTNGEDGSFQGLMELIGIPYVGCSILASANGMDKITMKQILASHQIPVVEYSYCTDKEWFFERDMVVERVESTLSYPVIVKPANLGSSVGISVAKDRNELIESIDTSVTYTTRIIIERLVEELTEVNCSVIGDYYNVKSSVCEKPLRSGGFLSYTDKYAGGSKSSGSGSKGMASTKREIPAILADGQTEQIKQLAESTFKVLSCCGISRIDVMIDGRDGEIYVNEINTIPGSLSFYMWEATGLDFTLMVDELIHGAFMRHQEVSKKSVSYGANILSLNGKGCKGSKN